MIIRNDDVSYDTKLSEIKQFCEICDKYNIKIIQAITPFGDCLKGKSAKLKNDQIKALSNKKFIENREVVDYLKARHDFIAVHGLWHTHEPTVDEIKQAKEILEVAGFHPTYFVPPFNEGDYPNEVHGLKVLKLSSTKGERLEDFLDYGTPTSETVYLHSWRFDNEIQRQRRYSWYTFEKLDKCLQRFKSPIIKLNLGCKHRKLAEFDNLDKVFGWTFQEGLPRYKNSSVDAVTISHALMFLTDDELSTFLKEAFRVLKTGGVIRITEDDTENQESEWYKTGNLKSGPKCLTGPKMMRKMLEKNGFEVYDVDRTKTYFSNNSLIQAYRGGQPNYFFIEGVKK